MCRTGPVHGQVLLRKTHPSYRGFYHANPRVIKRSLIEQSKMAMIKEDASYYILRKLAAQPQITQRELAQDLGISLGKVNYCLQALIAKGMVKARNFNNSQNKKAYLYVLTPAGLDNKATITKRFLKRKMDEYEVLREEIERLQRDIAITELEAE